MTDIETCLADARNVAMEAYVDFQRSSADSRAVHADETSGYFDDGHPYDAQQSEALVIPGLLTATEISRIDRAAQVCSEVRSARNADAVDFLGPDSHTAIYLHRDEFFMKAHGRLCNKLVDAMRSQGPPGRWGDPSVPLHIRCVEYHTYPAGSGHLMAGHRDRGSELTMSVLLSRSSLEAVDTHSDSGSDSDDCHTTAFEGGRFVTYTNGEITAHEMGLGDAILFRSEKYHNVATITRGTRRSLVIELWMGPANLKDRFS